MSKTYTILLEGKKIGTSQLEYGDPPMGVVFGKIELTDATINYTWLRKYCKDKHITIGYDFPEDLMITTLAIPALQVFTDTGIEIKAGALSLEGTDAEGYNINIVGVNSPSYEEEFPHHLQAYNDRFKE